MDDPSFIRGYLAHDLDVESAVGFPVMSGGQVVAVLEFFSNVSQKEDSKLIEVMSKIGHQLGPNFEKF